MRQYVNSLGCTDQLYNVDNGFSFSIQGVGESRERRHAKGNENIFQT